MTGPDPTALAVAAGRAIETSRSDGLISDPFARRLVEESGASFPVEWPRDLAEVSPFDEPLLLGSLYIGMRTRFIDDAVISAGVDAQVVILGAGLDTRAFRLDLRGPVFELDGEDTLAFKAGIVGDRTGRHAVPADLTQPFDELLLQAGFDANRPTVWVVEGLFPYLPSAAQQVVLDTIVALSAPGSTAILERSVPLDTGGDDLDTKLEEFHAKTGIPMADLLARANPPEPAAFFEAAGWTTEQTSVADLSRHFGRPLSLDPDVSLNPADDSDPSRGGFVVARS